jgi:hypothetical protein
LDGGDEAVQKILKRKQQYCERFKSVTKLSPEPARRSQTPSAETFSTSGMELSSRILEEEVVSPKLSEHGIPSLCLIDFSYFGLYGPPSRYDTTDFGNEYIEYITEKV